MKLSSSWKTIFTAYQALQENRAVQKLPKLSIPAAAAMLAVNQTTLWRIVNHYAHRNLVPKYENCGAESEWAGVLKNELFTAKLLDIYLATIGGSGGNVIAGRRTAKMATALTLMADEAECPAELAKKFREGKFPVCFTRWLKAVTPEVEQRIRGAKHAQLNNMTSRRDLTMRFPDGSRADMPAGFKWVFDDMSVNQPFWANVDGKILFSRQGLYALDHRSLRWLGKMLIARPREAYRAEDILRFLRLLFSLYGKPDMIVFEQGVWKARKIHGYRITTTEAIVEEEIERPEMDEHARNDLSAGLAAIGVRVVFATSAHGKIIETCFNHLQDIIAVKAREFVNIGRHASEFEIAAKRMDDLRHGAHIVALGRDKSSTRFDNKEVDRVVSFFKLMANDADLAAVMNLENPEIGERKRLVIRINRLKIPDAVVDGVCKRAFAPVYTAGFWEDLPLVNLRSLAGILTEIKERKLQTQMHADQHR